MAKQIFFDDFNGVFDTSKWSPVWGKFDPDKGTQMRFTDKNVLPVVDNKQFYSLRLEGTVAEGADAAKAPFLSGMVSTRKPDKGEILFQAKGQFILSVRAKMPTAGSSWPGIWMTGTKGDWPACGEIDILEAKGWLPGDYQMNTHTPRPGEPTKSQQHGMTLSKSGSPWYGRHYNGTSDYYTYSVVKLNDRVDFYLGALLVHTVMYSEMDDPTPFTDPENGWIIRLSHIIGGSFLEYEGNTEYVDATKHKSDYPSSMWIKYVRVISLDEVGTVMPTGYDGDLDLVSEYKHIVPTQPTAPVAPPSPQPPTPPRPEPPVEPTPSPTPAPVPKSRGERAKGDWVREEDALVFIML